MIELKQPISEQEIKNLKMGDLVKVNGIIFTARDMAHKFLTEKKQPNFEKQFNQGIIYHCGPIVRENKKNNQTHYSIISAGPTTSIREEPYEFQVIKDYKIRAVIGKGGMGKKTIQACKEFGCVYLHAIGGTGALIADCIKKVRKVYKPEFGIPEAIWELEVSDIICVVTIDSHGSSLHDKILKESEEKLKILNKKGA